MDSGEGVSLPLIHKHLMVTRDSRQQGDCCGGFKSIADGYYCYECDYFVHKECSESSKYISLPFIHHHFVILCKAVWKGECCGLFGTMTDGYYCQSCNFFVHKKCSESSKYIALPFIHQHLLILWNDMRKGDCCGRFEAITDGYYCQSCDFFIHKKCGDEATKYINHPSHSRHPLWIEYDKYCKQRCDLCGRIIVDQYYECYPCKFYIHPRCAKYPPPDVIDNSETHRHKLNLLKVWTEFDCEARCGKHSDSKFPYKCNECDISFHLNCVWNQPEIIVERPLEENHTYHFLHPLKLLTGQPPDYCDGKCRLCGRKVDKQFYHCSSCNFTLDMRCVLHPPPQSLLDLKVHDHQLTLLPKLDSFTCNACGLKGDRSPYVCFQCGFTIHQDCLGLPRLININRHDHRVSRTSVLGVVNSVCGVCREKVDWTCGGYSCQRCLGYVVHAKCATRKDVWNGKELEGVPEEIEDINPYVVIDGNTIQHFSHKGNIKKEHYLRLNVDGIICDDNKRCNACNHPICLQSFYGCIDCDFILHQNCAELPKKKWHVLDNEKLTLATSCRFIVCAACGRHSNGFVYKYESITLDIRCGSISEPFVHPSHPYHPLYYIPRDKDEICSGCNKKEHRILRCIEDGCEFVLGFNCATLPPVVKHRVDDHPLSLCYGDNEEASGKLWCDICEKESDPRKWFYTCKDHRACLHIKCVFGDYAGFRPRRWIKNYWQEFKVLLNTRVTRPFCRVCESRCIYPTILKRLGLPHTYICSHNCVSTFFANMR